MNTNTICFTYQLEIWDKNSVYELDSLLNVSSDAKNVGEEQPLWEAEFLQRFRTILLVCPEEVWSMENQVIAKLQESHFRNKYRFCAVPVPYLCQK